MLARFFDDAIRVEYRVESHAPWLPVLAFGIRRVADRYEVLVALDVTRRTQRVWVPRAQIRPMPEDAAARMHVRRATAPVRPADGVPEPS